MQINVTKHSGFTVGDEEEVSRSSAVGHLLHTEHREAGEGSGPSLLEHNVCVSACLCGRRVLSLSQTGHVTTCR